MSITLTTGTLVQINGSTVENDTVGAVVSMTVDYIGGVTSFVLKTGSLLNGNLNAGIYGPVLTLAVNMATGAYTVQNSQGVVISTGTVSSTALTNFVSQFASMRNTVETFCAGTSGIMPGTQVAWPSTSI